MTEIRRSGDTFETERDDEVERWIALGYVKFARARKRSRK